MDELERLLARADALVKEADATDDASARIVMLAQAAETWLHINHLLKRLQ